MTLMGFFQRNRRVIIFQILLLTLALRIWWPKLLLSYRGGLTSSSLSVVDGNGRTTDARIIFMSCNRQKLYNPFWDILLKIKPTGIIWMGDNIYADFDGNQKEVLQIVLRNLALHPVKTLKAIFKRTEKLFPPASLKDIQEGYRKVLSNPKYQAILAMPSLSFITGIWDDHDYGENDGDKTYKLKQQSKKYMLDFIGIPKSDERYKDDHMGVYGIHHYTVQSSQGLQHNISIILLDTRYNKDPWTSREGDFLGEQQWSWLENILSTSQADSHLIVSSIQVLPEGRFTECWYGFPRARKRLLDLITYNKVKNPIFLSGDVHFGEICTYEHRTETNETMKFWEFTSSGLTHAIRETPLGFGLLMDVILRWIVPSEQTLMAPNKYKGIYTLRNMGVLDIYEVDSTWIYSFNIIDAKNQIVLSTNLTMT